MLTAINSENFSVLLNKLSDSEIEIIYKSVRKEALRRELDTQGFDIDVWNKQ